MEATEERCETLLRQVESLEYQLEKIKEQHRHDPEPKQKTLDRYQLELSKYQSLASRQENEIKELKVKLIEEIEKNKPLSDSVSKLTSERSKWSRKLKRAGIKT